MEISFEQVTLELISALDEERDAAKRGSPNEAVALRAGRRYASSPGHYRYSFLLDQELDIPSDTRGLLEVGDERQAAEVLGLQGYDIRLAVSADIGATVPTATLMVSAHFILDILKARLGRMLSEDAEVNRHLTMALFGYGHCDPPKTKDGYPDLGGVDGLNPEQVEAIIASLGRSVSFIWGPPGTGKTVTAGRLVGVPLREERVLVTSHTNVAVDTALLAVLRYLPDDRRGAGHVVRVGPPQREEPELAAVTLEALLERRAAPLMRERADLREQHRHLVGRIAHLNRALDRAQSHDGTSSAERVALARDCSEPGLEDGPTSENSLGVCAEERAQAREQLEALDERLAQTERQVQELSASIVSEARVVAATLCRLATNEVLCRLDFDTILVDEASMAPLPYLWFASSRSRKRVVCVGDFRQLSPIARADNPQQYPAAAKWMTRSIFEHAGVIDGEGKVSAEDRRLSSLRRQYRMHPVIGQLANRLAYPDNPLEHSGAPSVFLRGTKSSPRPGLAVVFCDTSPVDPWCARPERGWSRYGLFSALVSVLMARDALNDGARDAAVITPYRAQARLLQALIEANGLDRQRVQTATVHRFQGGEKDVVILDLVDSSPYGVSRLLRGAFGSAAMRLLNVACTRARGKLVIVGNQSYLDARTPPADCLRTVLEYPGPYRYLDARAVLEGHLTEPGAAHLPAPGLGLHSDREFLGNFLDDLQEASEQVVIASPHARGCRLAQLAPHLLRLVERGVSVVIITTRPTEHGVHRMLLEWASLRALHVIFSSNVHQKVAFVDGRVAYFGSSHILSPTYWGGHMVRVHHRSLVERMMEVTGASLWARRARQRAEKEALLELVGPYLQEHAGPHQCKDCGRDLKLLWGRFGPFWGCRFQHDTVDIPVDTVAAAIDALRLPCPECTGRRQVVSRGRRYPVLSCSRWPECRWCLPLGRE
jgi:hypothetical protein